MGRTLIATIVLVTAVASAARATDMFWTNGDGVFSDASHWTESSPIDSPPPNSGDIAHWGVTNGPFLIVSYTVSFSTSPTNLRAIIEDDRVTFDLNGHTYSTTSTSLAMQIGTEAARSGQLTVTDGLVSLPSASDVEIATAAGGSGVLTVSTGGLVYGSADLLIGVNGNGTLNLINDGDLIASTVQMGKNAGSMGNANVTAAGSRFTTEAITVGVGGTSTLNVQGGGRVISTDGTIGDLAGSVGTATVSGASSQWQLSGQLRVGRLGEGTLRIEGGGTVRNTDGLVKGLAVVTGGSTWINTGVLNVGMTTTSSGSLTIESGSHVESAGSNLAISTGGQAFGLVRDSGTTWVNSGALNVGLGGEGELTIETGAAVTSVGGSVATTAGSKGTARITGATSKWTTSGDFSIGDGGTGQLDVDAGQLLFTNNSDLIVGDGATGVLDIRAGGKALDAQEAVIGNQTAGVGQITVSGANSQLRITNQLTIGSSGRGALVVADGGRASNAVGLIQALSSARVQGTNSTWTNGGTLNLFGNSLLKVENGGAVSSVGSNIGLSSGATAVATVNNATWTNSGTLNVGLGGNGQLTVEAGGSVSNLGASIASLAGTNGTVLVNGATSAWNCSGTLYVGERGQGNLQISAGGTVNSTGGLVGDRPASTGVVTVSGANSNWTTTSGTLFVGTNGHATANIGAGGSIVASVISIGTGLGGFGSVLVDGNNARLTTTGSLSVGSEGTGELNITGGGRVSSSLAMLGKFTSGTGTARVSGSGSLWTISDQLLIGGSGAVANNGAATVRIQPGGTVNVSKDTVVYAGDQLILEGGTLSTTAIGFNGAGTFAWTSGTLHVGSYTGNLTTPDDGILAPGNSIGTTNIDGNYIQRSHGTLEVEVGGPTSADFVGITGVADLSGELQLKLINGSLPGPASFVVFDSRGINGAFINVANGQRLTTADGSGSFVVNYGGSSAFNPLQIVLSSFLAAPLVGDYNQNGIVDAADYTVWRDRLGSATSLPNDDTPGVGNDDYTRWRTHFGQTIGAGSLTNNTVPEPATQIGTALLAVCGLLVRKRRDPEIFGRRSPFRSKDLPASAVQV